MRWEKSCWLTFYMVLPKNLPTHYYKFEIWVILISFMFTCRNSNAKTVLRNREKLISHNHLIQWIFGFRWLLTRSCLGTPNISIFSRRPKMFVMNIPSNIKTTLNHFHSNGFVNILKINSKTLFHKQFSYLVFGKSITAHVIAANFLKAEL